MEHSVYIVRIVCVYLSLFAIFSLLSHHLFTLQITNHQALFYKAKSTYTASTTQTGKRGCVFDKKGNPLIGNLACKDILADLSRMPEDQDIRNLIITYLIRNLDVDQTVLNRRFNSAAVEVVVKKRVDMEIAQKIEKLQLPGIRFVDNQMRYYPKGKLLANVLGFTDSRNNGVHGIEATWDKELSPGETTRYFERDRKGQTISRDVSTTTKHVDGKSIFLTVDEPIQHIMEVELGKMVEKFSPRYAYGIMADPKTGAIMAMAQLPSFDPNDRREITADVWNNHIISDVYDPGSTMKCIAVAGALDYGIVNLNTVVDCEDGGWYYGGRLLRDSGHSYGLLKVDEIIQKSSNIGTAKIALMMGKKRLYQTLKRFGFGAKTGLTLNHESAGIFRDLHHWDGLSITRFPIGQGISVTPLQMVQAYCGLANNGEIMRLHIIDRIVDPGTGSITYTETKPNNLAIREKAARDIVTAMTLVTSDGGTAVNAAIEGYTVAGKTGTSQKLVDGSYSGHGKYVASFIGFVPANNPAFVLLIVADEPSNGSYYGGTVAAPAFRRIADQTLRYLGVPPDKTSLASFE